MAQEYITLFQKHFQREVSASPEAQRAFQQLLQVKENILIRNTFLPLFLSSVGACNDLFQYTNGSAYYLGKGLALGYKHLYKTASYTVALPIYTAANMLHKGILSMGRLIFPGCSYKNTFSMYTWPEKPLKKQLLRKEIEKYAAAAIKASISEETAKIYSPLAWRDMVEAYSTAELLNVHSLLFSRHNNLFPRIKFKAYMYNEPLDRVFRLNSTWTLSPSTPGYHIHKARVEEEALL